MGDFDEVGRQMTRITYLHIQHDLKIQSDDLNRMTARKTPELGISL